MNTQNSQPFLSGFRELRLNENLGDRWCLDLCQYLNPLLSADQLTGKDFVINQTQSLYPFKHTVARQPDRAHTIKCQEVNSIILTVTKRITTFQVST